MIIGGISLYRSFAMYEERKTFDVLKGTVPDFRIGKGDVIMSAIIDGEKSPTIPDKESGLYGKSVECDNSAVAEWNNQDWGIYVHNLTKSGTVCNITFIPAFQYLAELLEVPATNEDEFLANDNYVQKLVESEEGMTILSESSKLRDGFKNSSNYTDDVKKKLLNSTVISENQKYEGGLPCYIYWSQYGKFSDFTGEFVPNRSSTNATPLPDYSTSGSDKIFYMSASYAGTNVSATTGNKLDISQYNTLDIDVQTETNNLGLTGTFYYGLSENQDLGADFLFENHSVFKATQIRQNFILDLNEYDDSYYIKLYMIHNGEAGTHTIIARIYSIALY